METSFQELHKRSLVLSLCVEKIVQCEYYVTIFCKAKLTLSGGRIKIFPTTNYFPDCGIVFILHFQIWPLFVGFRFIVEI